MGKANDENFDILREILGGIPHGIIVLNRTGVISHCNSQGLINLNISRSLNEVIGTHSSKYFNRLPILKNIIQTRLSKDRRPFDLTSIPFQEKSLNIQGKFTSNYLILTIEDVTQLKKQESANLEAIIQPQEAERNRLAKEIHDGIGPVMSAILLHLDAVKSELNEIPKKTLKKINTIGELIQDAADDIRNISHALMPGALIDLGLVAALENLCRKANESERIQVNFYHFEMENRLNINLALNLYRIAQELLNNAFKHAQASIINLQLIKHSESIILMMEDDGMGFEKKELKYLKTKGIGLRNIQTRVKALNGQFNIDSQKGKGMIVTVEVPIKNQQHDNRTHS